MKRFLAICSICFFLTYISCTKEDPMEEEMEEACETSDITYGNSIKTLISGCNGSACHGSETGRSMANYEDAKSYAGQGRIIGALKHQNGFSPMPKNGSKLNDCSIEQINAWINAGFPE